MPALPDENDENFCQLIYSGAGVAESYRAAYPEEAANQAAGSHNTSGWRKKIQKPIARRIVELQYEDFADIERAASQLKTDREGMIANTLFTYEAAKREGNRQQMNVAGRLIAELGGLYDKNKSDNDKPVTVNMSFDKAAIRKDKRKKM